MKLSYLVAASLALVAPATAQAATYIFNGVCTSSGSSTTAACTSTNGSYGNSVTLNSTTSSSVQVKISAWQMNQSSPFTVSSAFLGAYSGGFGVTGIQDQNGSGNLHQIDNVNGYTDFVLLQFNTAVHLDGVNVNMYGINNVYDSDISFSNGSAIAPATWNANMNLTSYSGAWSNTAGNSSSTYLSDSATGFSKVWLVSASQLTSDRNDGFKLSSFTVSTPAVPEPATWAMMIMGFGLMGASLRRRKAGELLAA